MTEQPFDERNEIKTRGWRWWLIRIIIVLVGVPILSLLLGFVYETLASGSDWDRYPPPGELVDIGGYRLHLNCMGNRQADLPTVILEAGGGSASPDWALVQPEIARVMRVCSYDRAGRAWSDTGPIPRSSQVFATELHKLLDNADEKGPYILVGHSYGGHTVRIFASDYSDEVVGIVLVDARAEELSDHPFFAPVRDAQQMQLWATLARFGFFRFVGRNMLPASYREKLPDYPVPIMITARYFEMDAIEDEVASDEDVKKTDGFGDLPLIVIVHDTPDKVLFGSLEGEDLDEAERLFQEAQQKLAELSSNSQLIFAENSGHMVIIERDDIVVDAILDMLSAITY
jgi:pimeloyl-ACP methyl ester carboxylesterase